MTTQLQIFLVSLDYSVAAIGSIVALVALFILAEFALPEK
jgi:hypothetical protein